MIRKKIIFIIIAAFLLGVFCDRLINIGLEKNNSFIQKVLNKLEQRRIFNLPKAGTPLTICDFETNSDIDKWESGNAKIELSKEHAVSGEYSAMISIHPDPEYAGVKMEKYFKKNRQFTEWSRYEMLIFDVFNPGTEKERLILEIKDNQGSAKKINLYLEPGVNNHIQIDISQLWDEIKPTHISQLNLFLWNNQVEKIFYLDNVQLIPSAEIEKQNANIISADFLPKGNEQIYAGGDYFAFDKTNWLKANEAENLSFIEFPLIIKNYLPQNIAELYVSGGIPFPRGQLNLLDNIELVDAQGQNVNFQVKKLSYWPDKSIKWGLITFKSDLLAKEARPFYVRYSNISKPAQAKQIAVDNTSENVIVNTGKLKIRIGKKGGYLFDALWLDTNNDEKFDDTEIVSEKVDLVLVREGKEYFSHLDNNYSLTVEENGPIRTCLKAKGWFVSEKGEKFCEFIIRIYAFADSSYLKVQHTFIYTGYPENKYHYLYKGKNLPKNETIEAVYIKMPLKLQGANKFTFETDNKIMQGEWNNNIKLLQEKSNAYNIFNSERVMGSGDKLEGWIDVSTDTQGVALGVKNFWQQFPKSFYLDKKNESLLLYLWPSDTGDLDLKTTETAYGPDAVARGSAFGLAKTHDLAFYFHKGGYSVSNAKETIKGLCSDIQVIADPEWVAKTRVLGKISRMRPYDSIFAPAEEFLSRLFDWGARQIKNFGWYGMIDFGDTMSWYRKTAYDKSYDSWGWHPEGRWGWFNCEGVGTHMGALIQFLRTADYKYLEFGGNLARHIMDIDTCHYNTIANDKRLKGIIPDDYSQAGSMHRHNGNHWGDKNEETSHTNISGLLLYYYITGDERAKDVLDEVGSFFLSERITYFRHPDISPQRSVANVLWGDVLLYELTADEKYKKAADKWANLLYIGQKHTGAWAESYNPAKNRWDGTPNDGFMIHYTIPALIEYHKLTGNKAIAQSIIKATDFIINEEYSPFIDATAYSYWLTGDKKYSESVKNRFDFTVSHLRKSDDPIWDGMIYEKAYYSRVMEFLYKVPFAFEIAANEN